MYVIVRTLENAFPHMFAYWLLLLPLLLLLLMMMMMLMVDAVCSAY
jgi:hypothetical protein